MFYESLALFLEGNLAASVKFLSAYVPWPEYEIYTTEIITWVKKRKKQTRIFFVITNLKNENNFKVSTKRGRDK